MARGHPLSGKRVLEPKDFENQDFISLGPEVNVRGRIDEVFAAAKVNRRLLIDSQLSAAVCRMVAEGGGLSLIQPITAAEFMDQGIVVRPCRPRLTYQYSLLYPLHRSCSMIASELVELVKAELARNPLLTYQAAGPLCVLRQAQDEGNPSWHTREILTLREILRGIHERSSS
jgi:DNA-binding transcriptional LysR family regulator